MTRELFPRWVPSPTTMPAPRPRPSIATPEARRAFLEAVRDQWAVREQRALEAGAAAADALETARFWRVTVERELYRFDQRAAAR